MRKRVAITVMVALVLLMGMVLISCNKTNQKASESGAAKTVTPPNLPETQSGESAEAEMAPDPRGDESDRGVIDSQIAADLGVSEELVRETNARVIELLPKFGMEYDDATAEFFLPDTPLRAQVITITMEYLIAEKHKTVEEGEDEDRPAAVQRNLEDMLQEVHDQGLEMAKAEAAAAAETAESKPGYSPPSGYAIAKDIIGSWKSIREEQTDSSTSVEHDDDYYDAYMLNSDGSATMRLVRYGEDVKNVQLSYRYDAANGLLTLTSLEGKPQGTFRCLTKGSPDLLFLTQDNRSALKVFQQQYAGGGAATGGR